MDERSLSVQRWRRGQVRAAERARELERAEGPQPEQAVEELLAALDALEAMKLWPGPRDPVAERAVEDVRRRWAHIERRARDKTQ